MKSRIIEIAAWTNQHDSEIVTVSVTRKSETGFPIKYYHLDYKRAERLAYKLQTLRCYDDRILFRPFMASGTVGYVMERGVNQ